MKLIISESQLKKVINEIGGFDDKQSMGSHSSMIQNNISLKIIKTIDAMVTTKELLETPNITTENVIQIIDKLLEIFTDTSKMLDVFTPEIYLDKDYKDLLIKFNMKNKNFIKKLGMVKHISRGMSVMEIKNILNGVIGSVMDSYTDFSEIVNTINLKYINRMDSDFDPMNN